MVKDEKKLKEHWEKNFWEVGHIETHWIGATGEIVVAKMAIRKLIPLSDIMLYKDKIQVRLFEELGKISKGQKFKTSVFDIEITENDNVAIINLYLYSRPHIRKLGDAVKVLAEMEQTCPGYLQEEEETLDKVRLLTSFSEKCHYVLNRSETTNFNNQGFFFSAKEVLHKYWSLLQGTEEKKTLHTLSNIN